MDRKILIILGTIISLIFLFSCKPIEMNKISTEVEVKVTIEMELLNGEIVVENFMFPENSILSIRSDKNKSWLVYNIPNCKECHPTILKNRVVKYKIIH